MLLNEVPIAESAVRNDFEKMNSLAKLDERGKERKTNVRKGAEKNRRKKITFPFKEIEQKKHNNNARSCTCRI